MATAIKQRFANLLEKAQTSIDKTPPRQYYMALSLIILLSIKFVVMPAIESMKEQQEQLQRLADTLKSPELLDVQVIAMQEAVAEKRTEQDKWLSSFYTDSESKVKIDVANKLKAAAQERGLLFLSSRWVKTSKKLAEQFTSIEPLSYTVTVRGDFNQIKALIQDWQSYQPMLNITEVRIRDQRQEGVASVRMKMLVYRLKSGVSNS